MNRIQHLFSTKKNQILSVYFTAGFPKLTDTVEIIRNLTEQGVDMIEIGIPFSDPMADGPVIQQSSQTALQNGMSLKLLFTQLTAIRSVSSIPLLMMGYLNPVMQFGFENFCRECKRVGIDGLIIPDLPMKEYLEQYKPICDAYELEFVLLVTPETSDERIRMMDANTNGFIYLVSSASTTGAQSSFNSDKTAYFKRISDMKLKNPCLIGFGISNKETLDSAFEHANGAIIGSKFIQLLQSEPTVSTAVSGLLKAIGK